MQISGKKSWLAYVAPKSELKGIDIEKSSNVIDLKVKAGLSMSLHVRCSERISWE